MTPVPKIEALSDSVTLYLGDCREVLPTLGKVDAVITDPPYGIAHTWKGGKGHGWGKADSDKAVRNDWDSSAPDAALLNLLSTLASEVVIWGGNYFALPPTKCLFVWDKLRGDTDFADGEVAWTSRDRAMRIFRYRWNGFLVDPTSTDDRVHPTQKPLALMKWCLTFFPLAKSVLDPFMGSGTTLRAAKDAGLTAVGIEREEKYCEIAAKRMAQEVMEFV